MPNNIPQTCLICGDDIATKYKLINHVKKHHGTWEKYIIETTYGGVRPTCKCGCSKLTHLSGHNEKFNEYIHGHNPIIFSTETRKSIGHKNSQKMSDYYKKHPDDALKRTSRMREFLTEETKKRATTASRKTTQSQKYRNETSQRSKQFWTANPDVRIRANEKCKQTWHERDAQGKYDDIKQHLSKMMINKLINNERVWQQGTYQPKDKDIIYRYKSSWELSAMKELDTNSAVLDWTYESISITYIDENGTTRRHVPDFIVSLSTGQKMILEIKPRKLLISSPRQKLKVQAAKEFCAKNGYTYILHDIQDGNLSSILGS